MQNVRHDWQIKVPASFTTACQSHFPVSSSFQKLFSARSACSPTCPCRAPSQWVTQQFGRRGNESPLSNICRITAVKEVNLLLHNIGPIISPSVWINHQASTQVDLLPNAKWLSSMWPLNYWELGTEQLVSLLFVLGGAIKRCSIIILTLRMLTLNVNFTLWMLGYRTVIQYPK